MGVCVWEVDLERLLAADLLVRSTMSLSGSEAVDGVGESSGEEVKGEGGVVPRLVPLRGGRGRGLRL